MVARAGTSADVFVLWHDTGSCTTCWVLTRSRYDLGALVRRSAPPGVRPVAGQPAANVDDLVFANRTDGMAVVTSTSGADALYVTHDGARSWERWPLARYGSVMSLVATPGGFDATERLCSSATSPCPDELLLQASPVAREWTSRPVPLVRGARGQMTSVGAWGHDVWLAGSTTQKPYSYLAISTNGGRTFSTRPEVKLMTITSCGVDPMSATSLWATCLGGHAFTILHSADAGASWQWATTPAPPMAQGSGYYPVSGSESYLFLALTQRFYAISDGGAHVTVRGSSPLTFLDGLVFTSASDGVAIGQKQVGGAYRLEVTRDGARHWRLVSN